MRRIYPYVLLAVATTLGAGADILVTTDGSTIETRGPWQQKGKLVVFTLANGQLSSLKAEDVDFAATERRNAPATDEAAVAKPTAPERPVAKIVITDADVAHGPPEPAGAVDGATAGEPTGEDPGDPAAATTRVRVIAWDQEEPDDGEGRVIFGTLRNDGNTFATDITLEVKVYEDAGALAGTQSITPVKTSLRPGESTTFRAQFREAYSVGATRMTVSSLELDVGAAQDAPERELDG